MLRPFALFGVLMASVLPVNLSLAATVTTDLWDVSRGTTVLSHSGVIGSSLITNMFGGTGGIELQNTLFRDDQPAGFIHFVEWQTPTAVTVANFNLFAHDDDRSNVGDRGFTRFQLFAQDLATGDFRLLYDFSPAGHPYYDLYPDFLVVSATIPEVTARVFRAEFTQFAPDDFPGPRIVELDGFGGSPVPEPSTLAMFLGLGGMGLIGAWRRRKRTA